jgi:hypothetical protein
MGERKLSEENKKRERTSDERKTVRKMNDAVRASNCGAVSGGQI